MYQDIQKKSWPRLHIIIIVIQRPLIDYNVHLLIIVRYTNSMHTLTKYSVVLVNHQQYLRLLYQLTESYTNVWLIARMSAGKYPLSLAVEQISNGALVYWIQTIVNIDESQQRPYYLIFLNIRRLACFRLSFTDGQFSKVSISVTLSYLEQLLHTKHINGFGLVM